MKKQFIKLADIILIAVILLSVLLWSMLKNTNDPCEAIIYVDGKEYMRINLEDQIRDEIIKIDSVVVYITGSGSVQINGSDCPDKVCMNSQAISKPGSTIACVPNKIVITVVKKDHYVDGVTG